MSQLRAGWYLDPQPDAPGMLRWWDGERWSEHTTTAEGVGSGESERLRLITRYWSEQPRSEAARLGGAVASGPVSRVGGSWSPPQDRTRVAAQWQPPAGVDPASWQPQGGAEGDPVRPEIDLSAVARIEGEATPLPAEDAPAVLGSFILGERGRSRDMRKIRRRLVGAGVVVALAGGGGALATRERPPGPAITETTARAAAPLVLLSEGDVPGSKVSGAVQTVTESGRVDRRVDRSIRSCVGGAQRPEAWAASTGSLQRGTSAITTRAVVYSPASAAAARALILNPKWGGCFVSAQTKMLAERKLTVLSAGGVPGVDKQAPVLRAVRFQLRLPSGKVSYQETVLLVVGQVGVEITTTSPTPADIGDQQRVARILADRAQSTQLP